MTNADQQPPARSWHNARSLAEFKIYIDKEKQITIEEEHLENLVKIFTIASTKEQQANLFVICLSNLMQKSSNKEIVENLISNFNEDAIIWQDHELFITESDKLVNRDLKPWFACSVHANDEAWLLERLLHMPYQSWQCAEDIIFKGKQDQKLLLDKGAECAKKGLLSCDFIVFLWKSFNKQQQEIAPFLAQPALAFRALGQDVRGSFIKGHKSLKKLLLEDQEFQKFLMDGGSDRGINALVSATRSLSGLDKGERQSLLIKIVRLYDHAKKFIEDKKAKVAVAKLQRITSVASYKEKQLELQNIIKVKIPENTEAIAVARDHGDLKENSEFKYAKENQKLLLSRKKELELLLQEVVPSNFADITIKDRVIPGCHVIINKDNKEEEFFILGVWDSNPSKGYISFETPLGKELLGKKINDSITLPDNSTGAIKAINSLPDAILQWAKGE